MGQPSINAIDSIGSSSTGNVASLRNSTLDRGIQSQVASLSDGLERALTASGKAQFDSPGARQDFRNQLEQAIGDIVGGARSNDEARVKRGLESLMALLDELKQASGESSESSEAAGGAGASEGASEGGGAGQDDMLQRLIKMLLEMGVPPDMIAQLLQAAGMPAEQVNGLLAQATAGQDAPLAGTGSSLPGRDAIAA